MLSWVHLSRELSKAGYKAVMPGLEMKLGGLQRQARALGVPVAVVFEGWDAAGKGTLINKLLLALDPRGFNVHPTNPPTEEERLRPYLWRFWTRTPARGRIAIFDRSWYGRVLVERVDKLVRKSEWRQAYGEINDFERQLADDGTVIIKFFLHIRKSTQKKRFKRLLANPATAWKVTKEDWRHHKQYAKYAEATEDMLRSTSRRGAPWTVIQAEDEHYAVVKIFRTAIRAMETGLARASRAAKRHAAVRLTAVRGAPLAKIRTWPTLSRDEYEDRLDTCQARLRDLEHEIYVRRVPIVILYEGWDAAGKGGNIKRLVSSMDPRGYEVVPVGAPNDVEKSHHYLWRFWTRIPKAGHIAVFDRSWYGRVLVERVEGFCREDEWRRAYREIKVMEEQLTGFGAVLVKFWLHVSMEEQLRRFREREREAHKRWKITDEDWRNRAKWRAYERAANEMLARTSTRRAPWTIVEANCKLHARIKALTTVIAAVEKRLGE